MVTAEEVRRVRLFEELGEAELKRIARELKAVDHPDGAPILVRGEPAIGFMVILSGDVLVTTASGRERRLGAGEHFGEMALLDRERRSADVRAVSAVRVGLITEWNFRSFLADHPEVAYRLLQTLSRRLREAEGR